MPSSHGGANFHVYANTVVTVNEINVVIDANTVYIQIEYLYI